MRLAALIAVLVLAGCGNPSLHTNIGIGPGGVTVSPVATARLGGATVSLRR
ncbi:hypothetical protein [Pseudorhodobacter sp.]|uniref:hypothetical protein n=1 Tax=Pseudorhodobacter sp. TaxID=1934400 RepID=UPI002AFE8573|nr:hypothetical protein [Pseudorhodobacter sp.]